MGPNAHRLRPGSDRGENVFTSARCIDEQCPTFKHFTNEALMSGDILAGDISIDQLAHF